MVHIKKLIYGIFGIFMALFFTTGYIFAKTALVPTTIQISTPPYTIVYTPAYSTGSAIKGPVYLEVVGDGIQTNNTGIFDNGDYTFGFYRGTGPFTSGAGYSTGNLRTFIKITTTIDRIDNIGPTFAGVVDGANYSTPVTITFSDNHPGVTATLNGAPLNNGSSITTNGTYQLIVTDTAGNTSGATFIVYLDATLPGGGGGGGIGGGGLGARTLTEDICETRSCYSYYYDDLCGSCTPPRIPILPGDWPPYHYATPVAPTIKNSPYPKEWNDAYLRAYDLGITTAPAIEDAQMDVPLLRKFAAKMASEFAIKVVGLSPDENRICEFTDINKEIPELQYYMRLACKLGIMGLDYYGEPDTVFNPNYVVTRDQLVTILSRMLFGNEYNIKYNELTFYEKAKNFVSHSISNISQALGIPMNVSTPLDWYTKHLAAIKKLGIITTYSPTIKEFRGYVMIIMYRIDMLGISQVKNSMDTPPAPL